MKSDMEIVEEVRAGNRVLFSELVQRHQKAILRLAMRFVKDLGTAEDIAQDSFIKAYQKLTTFAGQSSFRSWLFQIAINTAKNRIREGRREVTSIDNIQLAVNAVAETDLMSRDVREFIRSKIEKLPFRQKTAVILRVFEDLSFKEIAEVMDCPYDTAKANYRHGLMKLKHDLMKKGELENWSEQATDSFNAPDLMLAEVEQ